MSAEILVLLSARVSTLSVGERILHPWFESTAAVKTPLAVVRRCSHIPSYGGHCCPGVSRLVPADDDLSSSSSILSSFSKLKYTTDGGSGVCEMGLQCCTVPSHVTAVTCAASRSRFSTSRLRTAYSSSLNLPCSIALMSLLTFWRGIEIVSFNAFTSDYKLAAYSSGVGGSER